MNATPIQHTPQAITTTRDQSDHQSAALSSMPATLAGVMSESLMRDRIIGGLTLESTHRLATCSKQFQQIALTGMNTVAPKLVDALSTVTPQVKAHCKNMTIGDPNAPSKMQLVDQARQRSLQRGRLGIPAASAGTDVDGLHVPTQNPRDILLQRLRNRPR